MGLFVMRSGWKRAGVEGPGGSGHPQDGVCQHHTQQHPLHLQVRTLVGNKHNSQGDVVAELLLSVCLSC